MFDTEKIVDALRTQVIFNQTISPDVPQLDNTLVSPAQSRTVYHSLLTNENLYAVLNDFNSYVPTPTNVLINNFSDRLDQLRKQSVRNVIHSVLNIKKNKRITKRLLEDMNVFTGSGRINDIVQKRGALVGFRIELLHNRFALMLKKIGLQFKTLAPQDVNFHIFHSELSTELNSFTVNVQGDGSMEWFDLNEILKYQDFENGYEGGEFYIMYDEDEIIGNAITKQYRFDGAICSSCHRIEAQNYKKRSQYIKITPCRIESSDRPLSVNEMFDISRVQYNYQNNYGLNLNLSLECDLTDVFITNKDIFSDAIAKQLIVDLLKEVANTTRSNKDSEKIRERANFELQNSEIGGFDAIKNLENALDALHFELSDLSSDVCLPSLGSGGVRYKSVASARRSYYRQNYRYGY